MSKNLGKKFAIAFYVLTHSFVKTDIFCRLCKKTKKKHIAKNLILVSIFFIFT
jgi:hypothetical protein